MNQYKIQKIIGQGYSILTQRLRKRLPRSPPNLRQILRNKEGGADQQDHLTN